MANSISYASKLTSELDKVFVQSAVTGFMTDNAMRAKFVGAHTVIMPDLDMAGLADYDKATGFPDGSITVSQTSYTLSQDRGRSFMLDAQDEDESGVANLAGQVLSEFVRTKVVPEVDAYCLSKLAGIATTKTHTVSLGTGKTIANGVFELVRNLISKVRESTDYNEALVAFLDPTVYDALMATSEISRHLRLDEFSKGDITTRIQHIDGVGILPVPSARMKTAYTFMDVGADTDGGFAPTDTANSIGALVLPKKAASLVRKTEKLRTFTPDQNQKADAYKFDYRLYYDLFVAKSKLDSIYAYTY